MTAILANWNGEIMPLADVRVSVLDRAYLFGDGVYEALHLYRGRPFLLHEHFERLRRSLREIRIGCDVDRIQRRMFDTIAASGVQDGLAYFQVSRGVAARTHRFPDPPAVPNELIYIQPIDPHEHEERRRTGAKLVTFADLRWKRCDIKSLNLLGNCLAAQAAAEAGCDEVLLVATDGTITECSHTSIFGVKAGRLMTSPLGPHILPGITRGLVLDLARRARIPVREEPLHRDTLYEVDELFITGTTAEVLPVTVVDNRPIGNGQPGPVAQRLYATYEAAVEEWLARPA